MVFGEGPGQCFGTRWKCANGHEWVTAHGAAAWFTMPVCRECGQAPVVQRGEWFGAALLNALIADYNHPWPNEDEGTTRHRVRILGILRGLGGSQRAGQYRCDVCGEEYQLVLGVSHHIKDGEIDHDLDGHHVAYGREPADG